MNVVQFIADSVTDAVTQIRNQLGPDAIVIHVRRLPAEGLSRLWQKPKIEVLAYRPEPSAANASSTPAEPIHPPLARPSEQNALGQQLAPLPYAQEERLPGDIAQLSSAPAHRTADGWQLGPLLERTGLTPVNVQKVLDQSRLIRHNHPPTTLGDELGAVRRILANSWNPAPPEPEISPAVHVLIGPSGTGKTTCLCKWLVQSALLQNQRTEVWRLDGRTANLAENLSVYCEMLGCVLERTLPSQGPSGSCQRLLIDLPGITWTDPADVADLVQRLTQFPPAQVHLVLNAAYELGTLQAQVNAFTSANPADLIFTHLDEENRWGKLWNFVLGTKYSLRYLSAGQNIPGDFLSASPDLLLARQFPSK